MAKAKPEPRSRKRWVNDLLEHRDAVERAIGMPLGAMLGCGHFGCVFRSEGPWVVKLTVDPTEGPIWATIQEKIAEAVYGEDGFARVKEIVRLRPDVGKRKLYAIVREDCDPLMEGERGVFSKRTMRELGIPEHLIDDEENQFGVGRLHAAVQSPSALGQVDIEQRYWQRWHDLDRTLTGILRYLGFGRAARDLCGPRSRRVPQFTGYGMVSTCSEAKEKAVRAAELMQGGAVGAYLGESLGMLSDYDIVMFDLHLGNIGWRVHEQLTPDGNEAPLCLVVYDPGHTPTDEKTEIEERMIANCRWGG